jgi:hypothetical protein
MKKTFILVGTIASLFLTSTLFANAASESKCPSVNYIKHLSTKPYNVSGYDYDKNHHIAQLSFGHLGSAPQLGIVLAKASGDEASDVRAALSFITSLDKNITPTPGKGGNGNYCSYGGDVNVQQPWNSTWNPLGGFAILAAEISS